MELSCSQRLLAKAFFVNPLILELPSSVRIIRVQFSVEQTEIETIIGENTTGGQKVAVIRLDHTSKLSSQNRDLFQHLCVELKKMSAQSDERDIFQVKFEDFENAHSFSRFFTDARKNKDDEELDHECKKLWCHIYNNLKLYRVAIIGKSNYR